MNCEIFNTLKTRPVITTHAETLQVQGEFILKQPVKDSAEFPIFRYNFYVKDLNEIQHKLTDIINFFELQGKLA